MAEKQSQQEEKKQQNSYTQGNKTITTLSVIEGNKLERVSLNEALTRLSEIVKTNEEKMNDVFSKAQDWQSREKMSMRTFKVDNQEENKRELRTMIQVPTTFSKEQRAVLKEYAKQLGGTYTNLKILTKKPDGTMKESFPAQIEFSKGCAYSADICAKIMLGGKTEDILKEISERVKKVHEKQQAQAEAQKQEKKPEQKQEEAQKKTQQKKKGQSI
ncbi:MAG: hypothetical protein MJZ19_05310 [Paludibacteraceae bacterium]|nr:hypothetical protein [Paludibacteraceae bacterium]